MGVDITDIFSNETEEQEQLTRILTNKIKSLKAPQIKALLEFLDTYELKLKALNTHNNHNLKLKPKMEIEDKNYMIYAVSQTRAKEQRG